MIVGAVSNSNSSQYASSIQDRFKQRRENFDALANALSSGDLVSAQTAFAKVQQDMQQKPPDIPSSAPSNRTDTIGTDMETLSKSLSSGDLSGAQKAFKTLQQDMEKMRPPGPPPPPPSGVSASTSSSSDSTGSAVGTDFMTLLSSLGSGDYDTAKASFESLIEELQQGQTTQTSTQSFGPRADLETLSKSLESGDLASAKTAFAALQQHMLDALQRRAPYEADGAQAASMFSATGTMVNASA